jgi:hypothetical protein
MNLDYETSEAIREAPGPAEEAKGESLLLERRADGRLWAVQNGQAVAVKLVRCFPWSAPDCHLSLRDEEDEEVAFVVSAADLDPDSRATLEEALVAAGFVLEVQAIESLEEDFEIRRWTVRTRQGPRQFQTALDSWPREAPGGGLLIEDVAGDLFRIPPSEELDPKSQKLVWAFLD